MVEVEERMRDWTSAVLGLVGVMWGIWIGGNGWVLIVMGA